MPPRRGRGRTTRRTEEESRADSDDDVHKVEDVTRQIGGMELVLARFQRTNPSMFSAAEGGAMSEAWLAQMEELFDTLEYAPEKRLKLAVLQLRDNAQRWWRVHKIQSSSAFKLVVQLRTNLSNHLRPKLVFAEPETVYLNQLAQNLRPAGSKTNSYNPNSLSCKISTDKSSISCNHQFSKPCFKPKIIYTET
ncbi:hypothetical protein F511_14937 [Dorcoceras hygrometricum]|uniref:Uncharacterized protein n=1 Tax=Dorcoceras hygrometricum TaxID=472368 RepID=A0A2Z7DEU4_9LAMI|nr:hypothetical protein F511_14937 [Dorcoceras hygrometricum]